MRKPKDKLFACPKCNKLYKGQKCLKNHQQKLNHGFTFLVYYTSDLVSTMEYRLAQVEHKLNNLNLKNMVIKSSDYAIEKIKKEEIPKEKEANMINLTVVIQQLNVVFKTITPGDH